MEKPNQAAPDIPKPPLAERTDTVEVLHARSIPDPYQWLEDERAEPVQSFMAVHDAYARAYFSTYPERAAYHERLKALAYVDRRSPPIARGKRTFWWEKPSEREKEIYYSQRGAHPPAVLLDPLAMAPDGTLAIDSVTPSPSGELVAYLEKPDNADESILKVIEPGGTVLSKDTIRGLRYTAPTWAPDSSGFYYTWYPTDPAIPENERMGYAEIRFHEIGTEPSKDRVVRGKTGDPTRWQHARVSDDGRWLVVTVSRGWSETEVFVRDLRHGAAEWIHLTKGLPESIYDVTGHGDQLFVRTNEEASRYRVFAVRAGRYDRADWVEIIPEDPETVLEEVRVLGGQLVVHAIRRAVSVLTVRELDGSGARTVRLPGMGSILGFEGRADQPVAFFSFEGFDRPEEIWSLEVPSAKATLFHRTDVPLAPSSVRAEQVKYPSKDGTEVTMFVVRGPGAADDARSASPTLLYGYGGFNISMTPRFSPLVVAWVERGGVFAMPNLRGGGEYGEAWHRGGMLGNKQNVFDDFLGAAEYLVKEGWTSPAHLGISGRSNGGLLVGAAMTQRPDLFRAVVCGVPLLDMVRYHRFGIGPAWIPEYGTAERAEDLAWLLAYSPYHRVEKGTRYPALLMLSADHDDRVDPLHARKFVAQVRWATSSPHPVLLRIEPNSGHGGGDLRKKEVDCMADELAFLHGELYGGR